MAAGWGRERHGSGQRQGEKGTIRERGEDACWKVEEKQGMEAGKGKAKRWEDEGERKTI